MRTTDARPRTDVEGGGKVAGGWPEPTEGSPEPSVAEPPSACLSTIIATMADVRIEPIPLRSVGPAHQDFAEETPTPTGRSGLDQWEAPADIAEP